MREIQIASALVTQWTRRSGLPWLHFIIALTVHVAPSSLLNGIESSLRSLSRSMARRSLITYSHKDAMVPEAVVQHLAETSSCGG